MSATIFAIAASVSGSGRLSTDESAPTLESFVTGMDAPFSRPECVPAEELNQQFRDAGLPAFARTTASGSCDHAALEAELTE